MENIDKILKLKKQMIEKSVATKIKALEMTISQTRELKAARKKAAFFYAQIPTTKQMVRGADLLMQAEWIVTLNKKLEHLQVMGNELRIQVEKLKTELHELTVKSDLIETKIAQNRIAKKRIRDESTDERRLDTWVLKNNEQVH